MTTKKETQQLLLKALLLGFIFMLVFGIAFSLFGNTPSADYLNPTWIEKRLAKVGIDQLIAEYATQKK